MAFILGIAGGTGSGKTTLAGRIQESLGDEHSVIIHQDAYYKNHVDLPLHDRHSLNYDHPDAFDWPLLLSQIQALRQGEGVDVPIYNFHTHSRMKEASRVHPRAAIIVEGILIFDRVELRNLMDLKLFVDADADVRFIRRLMRDVQERGRSSESVVHQYLGTVRPMHLQFIEPSKRFADLIIPEGGHNEIVVCTLLSQIRQELRMKNMKNEE